MGTAGVYHIQISVSDLDRSLAFYTGLMGMEGTLPRRQGGFPTHAGRPRVIDAAAGRRPGEPEGGWHGPLWLLRASRGP